MPAGRAKSLTTTDGHVLGMNPFQAPEHGVFHFTVSTASPSSNITFTGKNRFYSIYTTCYYSFHVGFPSVEIVSMSAKLMWIYFCFCAAFVDCSTDPTRRIGSVGGLPASLKISPRSSLVQTPRHVEPDTRSYWFILGSVGHILVLTYNGIGYLLTAALILK